MRPLPPIAYYRQHRRYALLLVGLIVMMTVGLYSMSGILHSFLGNAFLTNNYLTRFSLATPSVTTDTSLAGVQKTALQERVQQDVAQIRIHPDVAHVIPGRLVYINVPTMAIAQPFPIVGIPEEDVQTLLEACDLQLKEGRMPHPHTNEIALSEEIAQALGLQVGDLIGHSIDQRYYESIPTEFTLVGVLTSTAKRSEPGVRLGIASYEYMDSHDLYHKMQTLIVIAQESRRAIVDDFLETLSPYMFVKSYKQQAMLYARARALLYLVFGLLDCLVAGIAALVVGVTNRIALAQRMEEFGLLHAVGYSKESLIRHVTSEITLVVSIGWVAGLVLSWMAFTWLKVNFYEARGMELDLVNLIPACFTVPVPLTVIGFVVLSVARVFSRLDPVAIIERGKLSMETIDELPVAQSSARPLSSWVFYLRHRSRGFVLVVAIALMVLGVALPVFFFSSMQNSQKPLLEHLRYMSVVSSRDRDIDPGVVTQIKTCPDVAYAIPTNPLGLAISVPPLVETAVQVYGVPKDGIPALVDLYGLELEEGHLPRTNEIVIPNAVARIRGLHVGDKVGQPIHERDGFPIEMVVSGILRPRPGRARPSNRLLLGFAPYEYQLDQGLVSSELRHLLVVPVEGRKAEMDAWLEANVASEHIEIETHSTRLGELEQDTWNMLFLFAVVESVIAVIAAIALAVLNYIFFSQRREEFGVLYAIGHSRPWLVWRAMKETASVVALAWLIGAIVCIIGLIVFQIGVYAPKGLNLDLLDAGPWLFTLPIPLAVIVVSAGTIARTLIRLDPVSVIERKS